MKTRVNNQILDRLYKTELYSYLSVLSWSTDSTVLYVIVINTSEGMRELKMLHHFNETKAEEFEI